MIQEYMRHRLLNLLENQLPPELFSMVLPYFDVDVVDVSRKWSQIDIVEHHLLEKGQITNMEAHDLYGIRHLPSVIKDLKDRLMEKRTYYIDFEDKTGVNRFGNKVKFRVYKLMKAEDEKEVA